MFAAIFEYKWFTKPSLGMYYICPACAKGFKLLRTIQVALELKLMYF